MQNNIIETIYERYPTLQKVPNEFILMCYENRKMYSNTHKKYMSFKALRELLREGKTLRFLEAKTLRDITQGKLVNMYQFLVKDDIKGKSSDELIEMVKGTTGKGDRLGDPVVKTKALKRREPLKWERFEDDFDPFERRV